MRDEIKRKLISMVDKDVELLVKKGREYGDSWKRRGGVGAFMMLARKWDRIEEAVKRHGWNVFEALAAEPGLMDDVIDLGCYLLLVRSETQSDYFEWKNAGPSTSASKWNEVSGSGWSVKVPAHPYANVERDMEQHEKDDAPDDDPWEKMSEMAAREVKKTKYAKLSEYNISLTKTTTHDEEEELLDAVEAWEAMPTDTRVSLDTVMERFRRVVVSYTSPHDHRIHVLV